MIEQICRVIRPTLSELMEMDLPLANAVCAVLPSLDGADGIARAFNSIGKK